MPIRVIPQSCGLVPYDSTANFFSRELSVLMENTGGKLVTHLYRETSLHHLTARTLSTIHYSALSSTCVSNPYFAAVSFIPLPFTYWVSPLNPAGISRKPKCTETLFCARHSAGQRARWWIKPPLQETFTQTSKM